VTYSPLSKPWTRASAALGKRRPFPHLHRLARFHSYAKPIHIRSFLRKFEVSPADFAAMLRPSHIGNATGLSNLTLWLGNPLVITNNSDFTRSIYPC
jgi:hypothetical protein